VLGHVILEHGEPAVDVEEETRYPARRRNPLAYGQTGLTVIIDGEYVFPPDAAAFLAPLSSSASPHVFCWRPRQFKFDEVRPARDYSFMNLSL